MRVKWLGQSGYLLDMNETIICIDPYLSDVVNEVEKMPRITAPPIKPEELRCHLYVSTHNHLDHLDPVTVTKMDKENVMFAGPASCIAHFEKLGVKPEKLILFERGQTICFNGIVMKGMFAEHTEDSIGVALFYQGKCYYFVGDSLFHERLGEKLEKVDVLFTCINGKMGNMTDIQAVDLTRKLHPRLVIPNHYGMFAANTADPQPFCRAVRKLGIKTYIPQVGETFETAEICRK